MASPLVENLIDIKVEDLSRSLIREFLIRHNLKKTLQTMQQEDTYQRNKMTKIQLIRSLCLEKLVKQNNSRTEGEKQITLIEIWVEYLYLKNQQRMSTSINSKDGSYTANSLNSFTYTQAVWNQSDINSNLGGTISSVSSGTQISSNNGKKSQSQVDLSSNSSKYSREARPQSSKGAFSNHDTTTGEQRRPSSSTHDDLNIPISNSNLYTSKDSSSFGGGMAISDPVRKNKNAEGNQLPSLNAAQIELPQKQRDLPPLENIKNNTSNYSSSTYNIVREDTDRDLSDLNIAKSIPDILHNEQKEEKQIGNYKISQGKNSQNNESINKDNSKNITFGEINSTNDNNIITNIANNNNNAKIVVDNFPSTLGESSQVNIESSNNKKIKPEVLEEPQIQKDSIQTTQEIKQTGEEHIIDQQIIPKDEKENLISPIQSQKQAEGNLKNENFIDLKTDQEFQLEKEKKSKEILQVKDQQALPPPTNNTYNFFQQKDEIPSQAVEITTMQKQKQQEISANQGNSSSSLSGIPPLIKPPQLNNDNPLNKNQTQEKQESGKIQKKDSTNDVFAELDEFNSDMNKMSSSGHGQNKNSIVNSEINFNDHTQVQAEEKKQTETKQKGIFDEDQQDFNDMLGGLDNKINKGSESEDEFDFGSSSQNQKSNYRGSGVGQGSSNLSKTSKMTNAILGFEDEQTTLQQKEQKRKNLEECKDYIPLQLLKRPQIENELSLEIDLNQKFQQSIKRNTGNGSVAIDTGVAQQVRKLLFGPSSNSKNLPESWSQGFIFNDDASPNFFGLLQKEGGPCGVIACVQAYYLKFLLFSEKKDENEEFFKNLNFRENCLMAALANILYKVARSNLKSFDSSFSSLPIRVALPAPNKGSSGSLSIENCCVINFKATNLESVYEFLNEYKNDFVCKKENKNFGVTSFMYSVILTKGVENILKEMDSEDCTFIGSHGHCSQEQVNLLLTGRSVTNVFDGEKALDQEYVLRGVESRSEIGFLTIFEYNKYFQVGKNFQVPELPIWVICKQFHYSVIFAKNHKVNSSEKFDIIFYDQLHNPDDRYQLTLSRQQKQQGNMVFKQKTNDHVIDEDQKNSDDEDDQPNLDENGEIEDDDLVPSLQQVLRTQWGKKLQVDWNGSTKIL